MKEVNEQVGNTGLEVNNLSDFFANKIAPLLKSVHLRISGAELRGHASGSSLDFGSSFLFYIADKFSPFETSTRTFLERDLINFVVRDLQFALRKEPKDASLNITSMNPSRGTVLSFQMAACTFIFAMCLSYF